VLPPGAEATEGRPLLPRFTADEKNTLPRVTAIEKTMPAEAASLREEFGVTYQCVRGHGCL